MSKFVKFYASSAIAMASLCGGQAWAQAEQDALQLQDIVITAERVETSLQRTPVAVTAVTGEVLTERGVDSLLEIGTFTPSLSVGSRTGQGTSAGNITIRGMGIDGRNTSPSVGVYLDEVYFPSSVGNLLGVFDAERIEILRGPQGTLFGRNTIAGAVQYVTIDPGDTFGGYLEATVGENERKDFRGALDIPMGEDLAGRIALGASERGGYVRDIANEEDRGEELTLQGRARVIWTPTDRLEIDLNAQGLYQESNGRAVIVTAVNPSTDCTPFIGTAAQFVCLAGVAPTASDLSSDTYSIPGFDAEDSSRFNFGQGSATISYDLTDSIRFRSISAYSMTRQRLFQDFDNTQNAIAEVNQGLVVTKLFTQEFQLQGDSFSDRLHWTTGVYYYDSEEENTGGYNIVGVFLQPLGDSIAEIVASAVYAHVTFDVTDKLALVIGARYSQEEMEVALAAPPIVGTAESENVSPHFGVNYQATDDILLYAKASRGFRAGGLTISPALINPARANGTVTYSPEQAWTYEVGARMSLFDQRLRLNPTVFMTDWSDIQFNSIDFTGLGGPFPVVLNAGDAEIQGIELESQFALTDRIVLSFAGSWLDAEYTEVTPSGPIFPVSLTSDLMRTPESKYAIGARYEHPLASGAAVAFNVDYSWTDEQRSAVTDRDFVTLPDFGLVNGRVQYTSADGAWTLAIFGENLTDEEYFIGGANLLSTTGTEIYDPGRSREFGVSLRANF